MESLARRVELVERDAWLDLFASAPEHVRGSLDLANSHLAGMGLLGCRAIPITELNRAMAVGVESETSRSDQLNAMDWLNANATGWALQVPPFALTDTITSVVADTSMAAKGTGWAKFVRTSGPSEPLSGDIEIERADASTAASFGSAVAGGFGLPAPCADWFAALVGRPAWHCFLALVNGTIAGGATMFVHDDAAWLGIAGTLPAFRNQGVQRHLLDRRIAAAADLGVTVLTCETGQPGEGQSMDFPSFRNIERAGFERLYVRPNFKRAD